MRQVLHLITTVLIIIGFNSKIEAQNQNIAILANRNSDNSIDLRYEKKQPGSYYIGLQFSNMTNCYTTEYETIINSPSGLVVKLRPINPNVSISYSLQYYSLLGEPNPNVDNDFLYVLPLKKGKKATIFEAQNLNEKYFGTEPPMNWKSYVINSKTPDTICSMRKGIVVKLINDYVSDNSQKLEYTSKRNSLIIQHSDGTLSEYKGFKKDAIFVQLGQTVYPQTELGIIDSFNTVYRLVFSVYYLFEKNINKDQILTLKNAKSKYEYVTPNFITDLGVVQIKSRKEYRVDCNESVMIQELTRSEKKKYFKDPTTFINEKK